MAVSWRPAWAITVSSRTALATEQDFICLFIFKVTFNHQIRCGKKREENVSFLEEKRQTNPQRRLSSLETAVPVGSGYSKLWALSMPAKPKPAPRLSERPGWPKAPCGKAISHLAASREPLYIPPFPPSRPDTLALQLMLAGAPGQCTVAGHRRKRYRDPRWGHWRDCDFRWAGPRQDFG